MRAPRWLEGRRERSQEGFEEFVAEHGDAIVALARGLSARDEDADELAERALARVLRRWRSLGAGEGAAQAAYGAVVRALVDLAAARSTGPAPVVETADGEDVDLDALDAARGSAPPGAVAGSRGDPVAALRTVPPHQRVVLLLRWLEDRDNAAVGRLLRVDAAEAGQRGRLALDASGLTADG